MFIKFELMEKLTVSCELVNAKLVGVQCNAEVSEQRIYVANYISAIRDKEKNSFNSIHNTGMYCMSPEVREGMSSGGVGQHCCIKDS